jgi:hypothetical protein
MRRIEARDRRHRGRGLLAVIDRNEALSRPSSTGE